MAKKIAPNKLASRASQMPLKTITDEEFLYGEVWKLHQEAPDSQALPSAKLPVMDAMHFDDRVAESLASNLLRPTSLEGAPDQTPVAQKLAGEVMHHSSELPLTTMPSLQITLTGQGVALDESPGLQNAITSNMAGDQDDNDAALALLPAVFSERLADLSSHAPMEAAWSGYDGVTGHHVLSLPLATTGYDLGFSNSLGHALSGEDSGLRTLQGEPIYLYTDSANNNIVLGKTNADVIVFSAYLQEINSSTNDVDLWTVLYQPLAHPDNLLPDESINLLNKIYVSVITGGVDNLKDATPGQHLFIMAGKASEAFVVTGLHPANQSAGVKPHSGDSVNISHAGEVTSVGTNNQMVDPPTYDKNGHVLKAAEGLTLTFVSGAEENYTGANLSPTEADVESNIQFTGLIETHFARFVVSQLQPSKACTLKISALNTQLETGAQFVDGLITGDTSVAVNRVRIVDHNGTLLEDTRDSVDSPQITVRFESGSAIVSGVKQGDQIEYFSESGHNRTVIMNVGSDQADFNASFDIGDFSIHHFESSTVEIGSKISFEDSAPETTGNPGIQLDDDALFGGNPGGIGDVGPDSANVTGTLAHSFGADGGSLAWLPEGAPAGFAYELGEGGALLVKQGESTVLTLSLNAATGDYSVVQGAPIHHIPGADENTQEFTLSYQVSDGDGDTTDGRLLIQVNDDTPTVAENLVIHLDDDALTGGLEGGIGDTEPDLQNVTGTLSHSYGADGPGQVAWQLEGAPVGFSYEQSGQDLLIKQADVLVITLTVDPVTGEYSTVQNAPIVNEPGLNENNQDFAVGYSVTDSDGDTVHGWLNITVNDDTPHGSFNEINLLDDDALPNGNPGGVGDISPDTAYATGNLDYGYGADGGSIAWLTTGAPAGFTYEASGTSLLVKQDGATVLTLTLDAETAAYTVIQNQAIQHAPGLDENTQQFNVAYRVTDADGDSADGEFLISVNDDSPTVGSNSLVLLDDDALSPGNAGGMGDVSPDNQNTTGILAHSFGADGGSIAWRSEGAPTGFAYEVSGNQLWVKQGSETVLTLTMVAETGLYVVEQNAAVRHLGDMQENDQLFSVGYEVTDGDGDIAQGELVISVNDDSPVVLAISDAIYANTDNPAPGGNGIFVYSVGADQRSDFSASDSDFAMFSLVGQVGVNSITSSVVSWQSETSHDLTFDFEFDYQPNPSSILTAHATGILSFHKDLGTYSVALSQPLDGMEILTTSRALSFTGYELESSVIDHTQPHVSVAKLSEQMYAQFTAVSEPGSGSGINNLQATGSDANNSNYAAGENFTQFHDWVSTSNLSNGVGGDTLQKGEVLDFDLFTSNPMGHTDAIPTASATALFLKFDGISSEDLVVVLKLSDMTTHAQTTRALVIDGSDILRRGNTLSSAYQIVLDNNDGAVIIEQNDYNGNGENYVITGAQVLTSTEGVTGQGIDFNSVTGSAGGSTATQNFGDATTDNDVIKISDIGVVTQSTSTLDSHLDFSFAVLDGDGDASATQHLSILIAGSASSLLDSLNG